MNVLTEEAVCMWVREQNKMNEFLSASFTLVCLQGQPDTCQCNEASGVWVHAGVVLGVWVPEHWYYPNECSGGEGSWYVCVRLRGWTGPINSLLHRGCFLLRIPLHLENLSHWLVEVSVLPGPLLPICFCVYVFVYRGVNLNLAKELNSLVRPRIALGRFLCTDPCSGVAMLLCLLLG